MDWYTLGCHAAFSKLGQRHALEKCAFGPQEAERIFQVTNPIVETIPRSALKDIGTGISSPYITRLRTLKSLQEWPELQKKLGPLADQLSHPLERLQRINKAIREGHRGHIFLPRKRRLILSDVKTQPELAPLAQQFTPEQHKLYDAIVRGHELDELSLAPYESLKRRNPFRDVYSHTNPRVFLREHARLATLPSEHAVVREAGQHFRGYPTVASKTGPFNFPSESTLLEKATRGPGGRPGITYGEAGTRLSRHAQKRVSMRMQQILHEIQGNEAFLNSLSEALSAVPPSIRKALRKGKL